MSTVKFLFLCGVSFALTACSAAKTDEWFVSHSGNMPSEERIAMVAKGDSQDKVLKVLGAPSSVVTFDKNTWIYMSSDIKKVAFFAPEEIDRDILKIHFSQDGRVVAITRLDKAPGENPGFFRKYFGGVGQYNPLGGMNSQNRL